MKESLAKTLYDLVRAEQFVPFSAASKAFDFFFRPHRSIRN